MARIREKTLKFPGLDNVYTFADEADLFDANVPCSVGEYRIYGGDLYRCTVAHTGAWNADHFTAAKLGNEVSSLRAEIEEAGPSGGAIVKTIENVPVASFSDGVEDSNAKKLVVNIAPVQSGSGDPAPDNVRPITGWTGVDVGVGSQNLFTIQGRSAYEQGSKSATDVIDLSAPMIIPGMQVVGIINPNNAPSNIVIGDNNSVTATVTASWYGVGFNVPVTPNTQYTVGANIPTGKGNVRKSFYTAQSKYISFTDNATFTTPANCYYLVLVVAGGTVGSEVEVNNIRLTLGGSATEYSDYVGNKVYPYTFPDAAGTVYGGTLTINEDGSGELVATITGKIFDGSDDENWSKYTTGSAGAYAMSIPATDITTSAGAGENVVVSNYLPAIARSATWGDYNLFISNLTVPQAIVTGISTITELADWKAYLAENPLQVMYPLNTPVTYQLTSQQVITLLDGINNVWADTGNIIQLQYYADSKNYIDGKDKLVKALIAPVLDEMVADTALVANDFRIVGDTLYIITGSIASGGTLTPGTNCTATTIGEQITALLT